MLFVSVLLFLLFILLLVFATISPIDSNEKLKGMSCVKVNSSHVSDLMGITVRSGREILTKIKLHFNREKHQIVTVDMFCEYFGIEANDSARAQLEKIMNK